MLVLPCWIAAPKPVRNDGVDRLAMCSPGQMRRLNATEMRSRVPR